MPASPQGAAVAVVHGRVELTKKRIQQLTRALRAGGETPPASPRKISTSPKKSVSRRSPNVSPRKKTTAQSSPLATTTNSPAPHAPRLPGAVSPAKYRSPSQGMLDLANSSGQGGRTKAALRYMNSPRSLVSAAAKLALYEPEPLNASTAPADAGMWSATDDENLESSSPYVTGKHGRETHPFVLRASTLKPSPQKTTPRNKAFRLSERDRKRQELERGHNIASRRDVDDMHSPVPSGEESRTPHKRVDMPSVPVSAEEPQNHDMTHEEDSVLFMTSDSAKTIMAQPQQPGQHHQSQQVLDAERRFQEQRQKYLESKEKAQTQAGTLTEQPANLPGRRGQAGPQPLKDTIMTKGIEPRGGGAGESWGLPPLHLSLLASNIVPDAMPTGDRKGAPVVTQGVAMSQQELEKTTAVPSMSLRAFLERQMSPPDAKCEELHLRQHHVTFPYRSALATLASAGSPRNAGEATALRLSGSPKVREGSPRSQAGSARGKPGTPRGGGNRVKGPRTEQVRAELNFDRIGSPRKVGGRDRERAATPDDVKRRGSQHVLSQSLTSQVSESSIASYLSNAVPMSPARAAARQQISDLRHSMAEAAKRLGNSHPHVEAARSHLAALRKHERELGWTELEQLHYTAIEEALEGGDLSNIDAAIQAAANSPLGKGHPVVQYGKKMLEAMNKERTRLEFEAVEAAQVQMLDAVRHDMHQLDAAREAAQEILGAAHPAVEAARTDVLRMQSEARQRQWEEKLDSAAQVVADAAAADDEEALMKAIHYADVECGLGPAHAIVEGGRVALSRIRRSHLHQERQQRVDEALMVLQSAVKEEQGIVQGDMAVAEWSSWVWLQSCATWDEARQDIQALKEALMLTRFVLGDKHPAILAAEKRFRSMRDEVNAGMYKATETLHADALEAAVQSGSLSKLEQAVRNAALSSLGPGHPMIDYHKRIIEEARKARVRMAREEEEEACRLMLSKALTSAQDAMETLETELEASYTPRHSTTVATSTVSVVSSPIPSRTHRTVA